MQERGVGHVAHCELDTQGGCVMLHWQQRACLGLNLNGKQVWGGWVVVEGGGGA